ncbi:HDIG domain-containing protein [Arenibacter sp. GZD96]|uniref:HD family phosphohydrolase n=1 Tax=Aurantibrevibacter litoralis TaxID=3106030 RepID=UPI002AFF5ABB|nr:HDIG domain-containing metalloprotein [Arenibacter sp. GZD-96]MEA1787009.1 HDIG domain-containing protein [Arenibacter sp. GZD-96]
MRKILDTVYKNQSVIYKYFLYFGAILFVVFFFPKGGKFKYEFQKGKPWQYESLYAPFDFSLQKTKEEIEEEQRLIKDQQIPYYTYDDSIAKSVLQRYQQLAPKAFNQLEIDNKERHILENIGREIVDSLYKNGIRQKDNDKEMNRLGSVYLVRNNEAKRINLNEIPEPSTVNSLVISLLEKAGLVPYRNVFNQLFLELITPNVFFDATLTQKELQSTLQSLSYTRGNIAQGKLIIAKGEVVENENYKILSSLKSEYQSDVWTANNHFFILFGYVVLVAMVLMMLFFFLNRYRQEIYQNNTKVTFIIFNIVLMVFLTTLVLKYNEIYVFVVPLCILPLILKTFFDARLGLYVHVLTVLILGFIVPNSFEYIFLQIIAGIVTILSVSELYKRANLFISVAQITSIYMVGYFAFHMIHEGSLDSIEWWTFGYFLLNGMITLFVQPLIYMYEKMFGLVSDVSLLELSDTNSKLLKELANKAPGTFHHSLQVANLAEAAANEVGANAMLVRVGALYHDIGKMNNPAYFTENQITNVNPHDELQPIDSAKIIINHVIQGIEIARKSNLPDRIIDFIRTHHGTSLVYYFYKKQKAKDLEENDVDTQEVDFRYPGPIPFSRETAILMMADAVEAASKSLKNPTFLIIDDFVEKIIGIQMQSGQFLNADITFKDIELIKKILKQKLTNIYHLRVEYPE